MIVAGGIAGDVNHTLKRPSVIVAGGIAGDVNHALKRPGVIVAGGSAGPRSVRPPNPAMA